MDIDRIEEGKENSGRYMIVKEKRGKSINPRQ